MSNIYYTPEAFGLTIVAMVEREPNYDFDMVVVWKDQDGNAYWGQDSGCSCPSPFEDYHTVDSLERLNGQTMRNLESAVDSLSVSVAEKDSFFRQLEKELGRLL